MDKEKGVEKGEVRLVIHDIFFNIYQIKQGVLIVFEPNLNFDNLPNEQNKEVLKGKWEIIEVTCKNEVHVIEQNQNTKR